MLILFGHILLPDHCAKFRHFPSQLFRFVLLFYKLYIFYFILVLQDSTKDTLFKFFDCFIVCFLCTVSLYSLLVFAFFDLRISHIVLINLLYIKFKFLFYLAQFMLQICFLIGFRYLFLFLYE